MAWELIHLDSPAATAAALSVFDSRRSHVEPVDPQQDISWYLDGKDCDPSLYFFYYEDDRDNTGICLLRRHERPVKVTLGEFVLYRHSVFRFELWSSPVLSVGDESCREQIVDELLAVLDRQLSNVEVLSIEGLRTDSPLFRSVSTSDSNRLYLQLGSPFMHQSIRFPETYDDYLGQMSKRSRKSVQYSRRKLDREFTVELFECDGPELIEKFLNDATAVSKKTYQWNLLGLGLRDRDAYRATLQHWERRADLRCFLLYCDATPTAFMLGYIYQSQYYYIDVGYDPDWAKYSVGSVLQLLVVENLYELPESPGFFDFSTGYGEHKGRFGNREQEEVNALILSATVKNRLFCFFYRAVEKTSNGVVALFDKLGVKKRVKKIIRRSSRSKA